MSHLGSVEIDGPSLSTYHSPATEEHDFIEHIQHPRRRLVDGHRHRPVALAHIRQSFGDRERSSGVCVFRDK